MGHVAPVTFVNTSVFYFCGCIGWLCPCGTRRFVTSVWDTSVGYFRTENYSGLISGTFLLVSSVRGMVTSGHPAGYFSVCLVSLLLEPFVYVDGHDGYFYDQSTGYSYFRGHAGWLLP